MYATDAIPVTLIAANVAPDPPPRTYDLTLDIAVLRFVPPAPSSTTSKSASARSAPISVPPSISKVESGVVPPDNPAPDPVNCPPVIVPDAVTAPVTPRVEPLNVRLPLSSRAVSYTHLTLPTILLV